MRNSAQTDQAIAEMVLGWEDIKTEQAQDWNGQPRMSGLMPVHEGDIKYLRREVPEFSANMTDAWEWIVAAMNKRGWKITLEQAKTSEAEIWFCWFIRCKPDGIAEVLGAAFEPTAPLAICVAALDAVNKETRRRSGHLSLTYYGGEHE